MTVAVKPESRAEGTNAERKGEVAPVSTATKTDAANPPPPQKATVSYQLIPICQMFFLPDLSKCPEIHTCSSPFLEFMINSLSKSLQQLDLEAILLICCVVTNHTIEPNN